MTRRAWTSSGWPGWLTQAMEITAGDPGSVSVPRDGYGDTALEITTLDGVMLVSWNDFIIQGVQGELYPCKPDIFEASYDEVAP